MEPVHGKVIGADFTGMHNNSEVDGVVLYVLVPKNTTVGAKDVAVIYRSASEFYKMEDPYQAGRDAAAAKQAEEETAKRIQSESTRKDTPLLDMLLDAFRAATQK